MKMYVCIKQIPDPNTVVSKLDPNTKRLVRSGVSLVLDPGDESTISAAIKLRDTAGNSEVVAVSLGPTSAQEAMRRSLAMGVDRAIHVTDPALAGSDVLGIDPSQVGEAGARERIVTIGQAEARAAGQVIKDDGNSAQAIANFLQRYQLL